MIDALCECIDQIRSLWKCKTIDLKSLGILLYYKTCQDVGDH